MMGPQRGGAANTSPPGEKDLQLKVTMRQIFWGMNYATRLNLLLALPGSRRTADELSDLDCVGFSVGGDFSVRLLIADCKSGGRVSPAARLFWLAGVRDFFGAERAYAVMQRSIPEGVREQAARLGVDVLGDNDRQILSNVHTPHAPQSGMFDVSGAQKLQALAKGLDKRLERLLRFRDHTYWHLAPERRIQRLLVELREAAPHLDARQRSHVVLVIDILFLLTLALLGACRHVTATSLADPRRSLLEYLLGGAEQTRAREQGLLTVSQALRELEREGIRLPSPLHGDPSIEPDYFPALAETVARLLRRPRDAQRLLRFIEWWGQAQVGLDGPQAPDALGAGYGDYTRKLVSDIARMAFRASGLTGPWKELAGTAGVEPQALEAKTPVSPSVPGQEPSPAPPTSPASASAAPDDLDTHRRLTDKLNRGDTKDRVDEARLPLDLGGDTE